MNFDLYVDKLLNHFGLEKKVIPILKQNAIYGNVINTDNYSDALVILCVYILSSDERKNQINLGLDLDSDLWTDDDIFLIHQSIFLVNEFYKFGITVYNIKIEETTIEFIDYLNESCSTYFENNSSTINKYTLKYELISMFHKMKHKIPNLNE